MSRIHTTPANTTTGLFWFRHDLRTADNPALRELSGAVDRLLCVYVADPNWFTPRHFQSRHMGSHRWRFICESLQALATELQAKGQRLLVLYDQPMLAISKLIDTYGVTHVAASAHCGYYERRQWASVEAQYPAIAFKLGTATTLFAAEQLPFALTDLPQHFTPFRKRVEDQSVDQPMAAPAIMPPFVTEYSELPQLATSAYPTRATAAAASSSAPAWRGGSEPGLARLRHYLHGSHGVKTYKQTRNGLQRWDDSTKLSAWLACGAISPKQVLTELKSYERQYGANESTYWVFFELLWREFFHWYAMRHDSQLFAFRGIRNKPLLTSFWPQRFAIWSQGNTQWPLVNALMKQLNTTGYMSNRGRQIVASCCVHELQLDWRYGAAYFEQQLLDFDVASNWGNWQYLAGVGADPRGHRHFDLDLQAAKFDPDNSFVNHWLTSQEVAEATEMTVQSLESDIADWPVSS